MLLFRNTYGGIGNCDGSVRWILRGVQNPPDKFPGGWERFDGGGTLLQHLVASAIIPTPHHP